MRRALRELGRPPRLSAGRAVLHEALLVALDDAADELGTRCTRLLRDGGGDTRALRELIAQLGGLLDALDSIATPPGGRS